MRGGHNKKPAALKIAEGTVDKTRLKPPPKRQQKKLIKLRCPFPVKSLAGRKWKAVVSGLTAFGIVDEIDATHLEGFCTAYQLARQADEIVKREGMVVSGSMGNPVKHPALAISSDNWNKVRHYGNDLGLTYLARTRMDGKEQSKEEDLESKYLG